jgi:hypothetical protein
MEIQTKGDTMEISFAVIINDSHIMAYFASGGHMMFRM